MIRTYRERKEKVIGEGKEEGKSDWGVVSVLKEETDSVKKKRQERVYQFVG